LRNDSDFEIQGQCAGGHKAVKLIAIQYVNLG